MQKQFKKNLHPSLFEKSFQILNCYDSHVHYFATGEIDFIPSLKSVSSIRDIQNLKFDLAKRKNNWIYGFGWDESKWPVPTEIHRNQLDQLFPDLPVLFSRIDGHSSWCSTKALVELGFLNSDSRELTDFGKQFNSKYPSIEMDQFGAATGVLKEAAHIHALQKMGDWSLQQKKSMFQTANQIFTKQGYTHVRDMTSTIDQYQMLKNLEDTKNLKMNLDLNFVVENNDQFRFLLTELKKENLKPSKQIRCRGFKVFYDGSLGSETALISEKYPNGKNGVALWELQDVKALMTGAFQNGFEVSVHTLGDQAVDEIVTIALEISQAGIFGRLNLEHLELCRSETIQKMKALHIRCHMQPAYWLSDKSWLLQKLPSMKSQMFQWELLRAAKVDLRFGSDSPIENPSVFQIQNGLLDSANDGILPFKGDFKAHCTSPYQDQISGKTHFDENGQIHVWFNEEKIQ